MVYNNTRSIKALMLAGKALRQMDGEFTAAQYNKAKAKGSATIARLVESKVLTVSRVETFEKEVYVAPWRRQKTESVLVNDNGAPIDGITVYYYRSQPASVKMAIDLAFNNGRPMRVIERVVGDTEKIVCKRYFYTVDFNTFEALMSKEKKQLFRVVNRKRELLEKSMRTFQAVHALYETLS